MSDLFFGFDVDRTAEIGRQLRLEATASERMSAAVRALLAQGHALAGAPGLSTLQRIGGALGFSASETRALNDISGGAPEMAAEIDRRLVQLVSCQALLNAGYVVDPGDVFNDERPADPARVADALARVRNGLTVDPGFNGNEDDVRCITTALSELSDAELEAALAALSDDELAAWEAAISRGDGFASSNGLSGDDRLALANMLLTRVNFATVRRIAEHMPSVHPRLDGEHDTHGFALATGPLFVDGASVMDINQGGLGDCWFLAGLGAVANGDPDFIREHIAANPNGTYTVTLYRDGEPVPVTVTADLPFNGSQLIYAGSTDKSGSSELWVALYEKAFAQYNNGYGHIEGGFGTQSMPAITGQDADMKWSEITSLGHMSRLTQEGHVITLGSKLDGAFWNDDDFIGDNNEVVSQHEYIVKSIDMDANPPTVTIVNPWGADGAGVPHILTFTENQMQDLFVGISIGRVG